MLNLKSILYIRIHIVYFKIHIIKYNLIRNIYLLLKRFKSHALVLEV